ncbi:MAG: hypothetical protein D6785_09580 [Planctomycetota bacterium]|nr:MAG: hypothetical protein D6785_09580 [Planctomycetota bacterium]
MKKVSHLNTWRKIALASWKTSKSPNVYGFLEVDAKAALEYMKTYQEREEVKITYTHFASKAIAMALKKHPHINSCIRWGTIYEREQVDLFLQVASSDGKDLSGTKIEKADEKTLAQFSRELQEKASLIRKGDDPQFKKTMKTMKRIPIPILRWLIRFSDFVGNTLQMSIPALGIPRDPFGSAMISSIGPLGIDVGFSNFPTFARTPLVVFIGKVAKRPFVVEDKVVPRETAILSATFDHRIVDGAGIGLFIRDVRDYLENPRDEIFHYPETMKE